MRIKNSRRKYIDYKIDSKNSREYPLKERQFDIDLTNIKYARTINTKYLQYNIYLYRKGKY